MKDRRALVAGEGILERIFPSRETSSRRTLLLFRYRPSPYKGEESQHPFVELVERQRLFFHSFPGSSPGAVRAIRLLNILDFPVIDCEPSTSVVSRVE